MLDLVIFDLDDTLARTAHRSHLLQDSLDAYERASVYDTPNEAVAAVFYDHFTASRDMWIVTARSDVVLEETEDWLFKNGVYYSRLLMRPAGDTRDEIDIKLRWLHDGTIPRERVLCAYDNNPSVIDMYQAEGITCFHVRS